MLKRSITLAVFSTSVAVCLVSPVFAVSQNFVSTFINTKTNTRVMARSISMKILEQQPQLIARPNCDGEDPPPICTGGEKPPRPTRQPTPNPIPNRNYSAIAFYLLNHYSLIKPIIDTTWNEAGKGIAAQQIKDQINGRQFSKGVSGYDANVNLGAITENQATLGSDPNQINVRVMIPGNDVNFKTTTPTVFGSYADPSFRLGFDLTVNLKISVGPNNFLEVVELNVQTSNANIHGSIS